MQAVQAIKKPPERRLMLFGFGGARRDRTADLLHAMQALSQLSYGPNLANHRRWTASGFFFLLHAVADDVGNIGAAGFLLLLDESGIFKPGVIFLAISASDRSLLAALLLRLGIFQRDKFGVGGLRHDGFGDRRRLGRIRPCPRRDYDRHELGLALRAHDRGAIEIIELRTATGAEALGAKIGFSHAKVPYGLSGK